MAIDCGRQRLSRRLDLHLARARGRRSLAGRAQHMQMTGSGRAACSVACGVLRDVLGRAVTVAAECAAETSQAGLCAIGGARSGTDSELETSAQCLVCERNR